MSVAPRPWTRRRAMAALALPWMAAPVRAALPGAERVRTVAIVPQFPAQRIRATWLPALERLAAITGERYELVHAPTIDDFEAQFLAGEPDFVFLNPYHMVMAADAQGYVPLLRDRRVLSGVLVVRKDSPLHTVAGLAGSTVAFPSPNALGASLYMRALLASQGVAVQASYVKTHSNVYRHVLTGAAAAGGGIRATLESEAPSVRDQLRVLYETPSVASHPVAAHPRVPQAERELFRRSLLAWAGDEAGRALLASLQMPDPISAEFERDYTPLKRLGLARFAVRNSE